MILVGVSGWSGSPSWPAGIQSGDVVVGVTLLATNEYGSPAPPWATVHHVEPTLGANSTRRVIWSGVWTGQVAPASAFPTDYVFNLMVLRGTAGVLRRPTAGVASSVVFGVAGANAPASGGVVVVSGESNARPSGVTWFPPGNPPKVVRSNGVSLGWDACGASDVEFAGSPVRLASAVTLVMDGPQRPYTTVVSPAPGGTYATSETVMVAWTTRNLAVPTDAYQVYAVRYTGSAYVFMYYNVSTGGWQASPVDNAGVASSVPLPVSVLTAGVVWDVAVRVRETATGMWRGPYDTADWSQLTVQSVPGVSVSVASPLNDLTPTVALTATTPNGALADVQVEVSGPGVTYFSGSLGAVTSHTVPAQPWVNGASYTVRVRVRQTAPSGYEGLWSGWVTAGFTVSWVEPVAPTIIAWPDHPGDGVLVEVAADPGREVQVDRFDGGLWVPVIRYVAVDAAHTLQDVFAPYGMECEYRARQATVLDAQVLFGPWRVSGPVVNTDQGTYLAVASDPARTWVSTPLREDGTRTRVRSAMVLDALGRTDPLPVYGTDRGWAGQFVVRQFARENVAATLDLLMSGNALMFRNAPESDLVEWTHEPPLCFVVADTIDVDRLVQAPYQYRDVGIPFRTTTTPGLSSTRTPPRERSESWD